MAQTWHDLLFAHWSLAPAAVRPTIPPPLRLDTFAGRAWVGVVPFRLTGLRLRGLPSLPGRAAFPELNVRTYVTSPRGDKPGVFFYSLDAGSPLAVAGARLLGLPYFTAHMAVRPLGDGVAYHSARAHRGAPPATFAAQYRPTGPVFQAAHGSLEEWLTERYCLYTVDRRGAAYRLEIHHRPWPLQPAEAELRFDALATQHGLALSPAPPRLHFARRQDMVAWPPRPA
jgi:uncharacterized protein YqjF (DUF2071 family)